MTTWSSTHEHRHPEEERLGSLASALYIYFCNTFALPAWFCSARASARLSHEKHAGHRDLAGALGCSASRIDRGRGPSAPLLQQDNRQPQTQQWCETAFLIRRCYAVLSSLAALYRLVTKTDRIGIVNALCAVLAKMLGLASDMPDATREGVSTVD